MPVSKENTIHDQPWPNVGQIWPNLGQFGPNWPNHVFTLKKNLFLHKSMQKPSEMKIQSQNLSFGPNFDPYRQN